MKSKRIYYRRMRNSMLIEGKNDKGNAVKLLTLGNAESFITKYMRAECNPSDEERLKILEKIQSVGYIKDKTKKKKQEVRLRKINTTFESHANSQETASGNNAEGLTKIDSAEKQILFSPSLTPDAITPKHSDGDGSDLVNQKYAPHITSSPSESKKKIKPNEEDIKKLWELTK